MYVIEHRVDELYFDEHAVDAAFVQTASLYILKEQFYFMKNVCFWK